MSQMLSSALCVSLLLSCAGCSDLGTTGPGKTGNAGTNVRQLTSAETAIVGADKSFGFKLFASLNAQETGKNLFISPLSVSMALGMTLNGANGATKDAMQTTLGFSGMTQDDINKSYASLTALLTQLDPKVELDIANSIWHRPALRVEEAFKDVNKQYFNAVVTPLDFTLPTAAATINSWVSDNTKGKITQIVPDKIPIEIVMYLINAVYFKGTWTYNFDSTATHDDVFHLADGSTTPCRMMAQETTLRYFQQDGIEGIDLPYGDAGFSMTVILPPPGTNIDNFVNGMTEQTWDSWVLRLTDQNVRLFLPKFTLEYTSPLEKVLKTLGMEIAFTGGADFTGIDRRGGLFISSVIHKTFLKVDEQGSEAAGVTAVGVRATAVGGGGENIIVMRVDRPFVCAIREGGSGTILFIGKIVLPN